MPNDNNFIPKENLAKVEEVREIEENEIIMPEEQVKVIDYFKERQNLIIKKSRLSPAARSKVIKRYGSDYLSERAFTHDIAVMQMYGPGFWDDYGGEIFRKVGSIALATTYFTPLGVVTAPMTAVAAGVGGTMWAAGKASDNGELKKAGGIIFGTAFDAATEGLGAGTLNAGAPAIAKVTKTLCQGYNGAGEILERSHGVPGPRERAALATHIVKYGL